MEVNNNIKVFIHLVELDSRSFLIPNFNYIPRKDDLIDVIDFIDCSMISDEDLEKIENLAWSVWYVSWGKDNDGFYAEIVCEGE